MTTLPIFQSYITVFFAELPDKTALTVVLLVTRYRSAFAVWLGAVTAFVLHVIAAVTVGRALSMFPEPIVDSITAVVFATGALVLLLRARAGDHAITNVGDRSSNALLASFGIVAVAEWGDLTQLATASLAATSDSTLATGIGAWLALACVAALAAGIGRRIRSRVSASRMHYTGAVVFALLAATTATSLL